MDEFKVRAAANASNKKYNVFKLHKDDQMNWTEAKMRRENDNQPWQIKFGSSRNSRRFKAIKEGGVGENASYFVFYKPNESSDTYEVCPIDEWYNVSATQRYKVLTAEEAEQKFEQRHKMLNLFSVMHLKKGGEAGEEAGSSYSQDTKNFKVSELDDWDYSGDDDASDNEDGNGEDCKKKQRKKTAKKEKEDPDEAPEEAKEESDEGDFEQREVDYMSDTSSDFSSDAKSEKDTNDVKGIAEEEALRDLLSTDDDDDADATTQKNSKPNENKTKMVDPKQDYDAEGSEDTSDSDDYDVDEEKMDSMFTKNNLPSQLSMVKQETKHDPESTSSAQSTSNTSKPASGASKRKAQPEVTLPVPQAPKRPCITEIASAASGFEKVVEDLIRKYLTRKPMTLKVLLKDIKSKLKKMDGVPPDMDNDLVNTIASIIKRLQPDRQKINDVTYLSLKS